MTKQALEKSIEAIIAAVATFPQSASVEDLFLEMHRKVPRRTLQRRLRQFGAWPGYLGCKA